MSIAITNRTQTAVGKSDNRMTIQAGQACREFQFAELYSEMRIAILGGFAFSRKSITGTDYFYLGVCHDRDKGVALDPPDAATHFVGIRNADLFSYDAANPDYLYCSKFRAYHGIGTGGAEFTSNDTPLYISNTPADVRSALIVSIKKGPVWSVKLVGPTTGAAAAIDMTAEKVDLMMSLTDLLGVGDIVPGYAVNTGWTFSVNEVSNGAMDCLNIAYSKNSTPLEITEIRHRRIA